jgi:hypothetical protein
MDRVVEIIGVAKGLMGEEMSLEVAPGMFDIVQFGGVLRQPFDGQPWTLGKSGPRCFAGMDGTVVDGDDDALDWPGRGP